MDDSGNLFKDANGDPVFIQDGDGKESVVNYAAISKKLQESSQGEAKYRKKVTELTDKYKPLEQVPDIAAYVRENEDIRAENARMKENTDVKQIEEKVQAVKTQMDKAWQDKEKAWSAQLEAQKALLKQAEEKVTALTAETHREKIRSMFNESAFIKEKCVLPAALLFDLFSGKAKINEEGAFAGLDPVTNEIAVGTDGKPLTLDNWLYSVIEAHPEGKNLLKGSTHSGPGGSSMAKGDIMANPWAADSYNITQQHILTQKNPELAKKMASQHGVNLQIA
jgi:hypothetical protein